MGDSSANVNHTRTTTPKQLAKQYLSKRLLQLALAQNNLE